MSVYMTEEEQLRVIGQWWKKNSNWITFILSIVLLALSGYKYWSWHTQKIQQDASNAYERLMYAYSNQDAKSIKSYANELITKYNQTVYCDVAHFVLAKTYIAKEQYGRAGEALQEIIKNPHVKAFQQIAKMRLARLYALEKKYDDALELLSVVESEAYLPAINEIKGDIFASQGRFKDAVKAYKVALSAASESGMGNPFLEMKNSELVSLTQALSQPENSKHKVA